MASTEGGVEIEKVAEETPEKIFKVIVDPLVGVMPFQCRDTAFKLGLDDEANQTIYPDNDWLWVKCLLNVI